MRGTKPTGGSAFPQANHDAYGMGPGTIDDTGVFDTNGMSLRDYFAANALHGICSHPDTWGLQDDGIADRAYHLADLMLAERAK